MALPMAAFAGGGALLSVLGGIGKNKAVEKARKRAIAEAGVKATQLHERLGRQVSKATGSVAVQQGARNSFGAGAKRLQLAILAEGLTEQANIEMTEFLEIGQINASASSQKTNLFTAALGGASSGMSFGASFGSMFGKSSVPQSPSNEGGNSNFAGLNPQNPSLGDFTATA